MLRKHLEILFKRYNRCNTQKKAEMKSSADSLDLLTDSFKASDIEEKART